MVVEILSSFSESKTMKGGQRYVPELYKSWLEDHTVFCREPFASYTLDQMSQRRSRHGQLAHRTTIFLTQRLEDIDYSNWTEGIGGHHDLLGVVILP
jgi:hypothetical protein